MGQMSSPAARPSGWPRHSLQVPRSRPGRRPGPRRACLRDAARRRPVDSWRLTAHPRRCRWSHDGGHIGPGDTVRVRVQVSPARSLHRGPRRRKRLSGPRQPGGCEHGAGRVAGWRHRHASTLTTPMAPMATITPALIRSTWTIPVPAADMYSHRRRCASCSRAILVPAAPEFHHPAVAAARMKKRSGAACADHRRC